MKTLSILAGLILLPVLLLAQPQTVPRPVTGTASSAGLIATNNLIRAAIIATNDLIRSQAAPYTNGAVTANAGNIRTNTATIDVSTNLFVSGTKYTNSARRIFVAASAQLTAAAAGTASVSLYSEIAGVCTNRVTVSAGPLASLVTVEQLSLIIGPGAIYYFTNETSGIGASVSIVANTCNKIEL